MYLHVESDCVHVLYIYAYECMCVRADDDGYFNDALSVAIYFYFTAFTHVSGL